MSQQQQQQQDPPSRLLYAIGAVFVCLWFASPPPLPSSPSPFSSPFPPTPQSPVSGVGVVCTLLVVCVVSALVSSTPLCPAAQQGEEVVCGGRVVVCAWAVVVCAVCGTALTCVWSEYQRLIGQWSSVRGAIYHVEAAAQQLTHSVKRRPSTPPLHAAFLRYVGLLVELAAAFPATPNELAPGASAPSSLPTNELRRLVDLPVSKRFPTVLGWASRALHSLVTQQCVDDVWCCAVDKRLTLALRCYDNLANHVPPTAAPQRAWLLTALLSLGVLLTVPTIPAVAVAYVVVLFVVGCWGICGALASAFASQWGATVRQAMAQRAKETLSVSCVLPPSDPPASLPPSSRIHRFTRKLAKPFQ